MEKRGFPSSTKHRGASTSKKEAAKKFSHREYFFKYKIFNINFLKSFFKFFNLIIYFFKYVMHIEFVTFI